MATTPNVSRVERIIGSSPGDSPCAPHLCRWLNHQVVLHQKLLLNIDAAPRSAWRRRFRAR